MPESAISSSQDEHGADQELRTICCNLQRIQARLDVLGEPLTAAHLDMAINALEQSLAATEAGGPTES
ncbi:hypothetical protein [Novosphingobium sp.]|uniref:hypothetical protein n=1 Tax=Novosphingobium sp. TaxID=1874826 RepID=UPI0035B3BAD8